MKKVIILAAFIVGISYSAEAQLKTNNTSKVEKVDDKTDAEKLTAYKDLLKALDTKEAWIRSNPEELKIAKEQGWFVKAENTRKDVQAKVAQIENKK
jgi:hypothetical protein